MGKMAHILKKTYNDQVLGTLENFSGFYKLDQGKYKHPILVSGVDGVGTKLHLATIFKKYDVIGKDCFAMCINDILCHGASPLFFLDYLSCGKLDISVIEEIIKGIAISCKNNNTCFIGGETAEMSGIYLKYDYDVAGFCVGIVEKDHIIDGHKLIQENDILIGIPSSGIHSNGFTLIRKIFSFKDFMKIVNKKPFYETLLIPTRVYYHSISHILHKKIIIHGISHITGGGISDNLTRILPEKLSALVETKEIPIPYIFHVIQNKGKISDKTMWNTFNMGVGMIVTVPINNVDVLLKELRIIGEKPFVLGKIVKGDKKVFLK